LHFVKLIGDESEMLEQTFLLRPGVFLREHLRRIEIEPGGMNRPTQIMRKLIEEFFEVGGGHIANLKSLKKWFGEFDKIIQIPTERTNSPVFVMQVMWEVGEKLTAIISLVMRCRIGAHDNSVACFYQSIAIGFDM